MYASISNHSFIFIGIYISIIVVIQPEFYYEKIKSGITIIAFIINIKAISDA
jgi:hypothetical protein